MELPFTFLLFTIATFQLCFPSSNSQAATNASSDQLALLSFKNTITDDPTGALRPWGNISAASYCQWLGVTCGTRGQRRGRVTALELPGLNLSGIISPALANLTFLRSLDLSQNHLHEYGIGNEVSTQGDIFSYGILLLELFTAKRPTDDAFLEGCSLRQYIEMGLPHKITEIIDQSLFITEQSGAYKSEIINKEDVDVTCIASVLTVGIQCSKEESTERTQINDALRELHMIRDQKIRQHS
ncbi:hypothetical protein U9M48_025219 [Paspalum notatum var. saurae]|uniref:Leucine-rich repeat-containing N-terminal plant-type domain-containing protein n=1 Tax=Paspalum notatum var. saurae TaxID=547442 RepID=A0AAQ3TQ24_PASNO